MISPKQTHAHYGKHLTLLCNIHLCPLKVYTQLHSKLLFSVIIVSNVERRTRKWTLITNVETEIIEKEIYIRTAHSTHNIQLFSICWAMRAEIASTSNWICMKCLHTIAFRSIIESAHKLTLMRFWCNEIQQAVLLIIRFLKTQNKILHPIIINAEIFVFQHAVTILWSNSNGTRATGNLLFECWFSGSTLVESIDSEISLSWFCMCSRWIEGQNEPFHRNQEPFVVLVRLLLANEPSLTVYRYAKRIAWIDQKLDFPCVRELMSWCAVQNILMNTTS